MTERKGSEERTTIKIKEEEMKILDSLFVLFYYFLGFRKKWNTRTERERTKEDFKNKS